MWIGSPLVIRAPYLRWSLYRGETLEGVCWVLREEGDGPTFYRLDLAQTPSVGDLVETLTPLVGRPIADTLADLAIEALPKVIST